MKDKELKLEEIETSHTLGGTGKDRVTVEKIHMLLCVTEAYSVSYWSYQRSHES